MIEVELQFEGDVSGEEQRNLLGILEAEMPSGTSLEVYEPGGFGKLDQVDPHSIQCVIDFLVEASQNPLVVSLTTAAVTEVLRSAISGKAHRKVRKLKIDGKDIPLGW